MTNYSPEPEMSERRLSRNSTIAELSITRGVIVVGSRDWPMRVRSRDSHSDRIVCCEPASAEAEHLLRFTFLCSLLTVI